MFGQEILVRVESYSERHEMVDGFLRKHVTDECQFKNAVRWKDTSLLSESTALQWIGHGSVLCGCSSKRMRHGLRFDLSKGILALAASECRSR